MKVLIAEDELLAADRLSSLLKDCDSEINIVETLDSVSDVVTFFKNGGAIDLLFLDIQLADGKSFEIFDKVAVSVPVIFTTAYDQFALDAFKVYSVDYLLKPIQFEDLNNAIKKLKKISSYHSSPLNWEAIQKLISQNATNFKERFILKSGNKLSYKHASEAAYFFADGKTTYLVTKKENRKYIIDYTLDELEAVLDPKLFFRINRKFILSIGSVSEVRGLISSGMEVKLNQPCEYDLSVSRDRSQKFKAWLDK